MVTTISEGKYIGDIIVYETPKEYCRAVLTIKQDAAATAGLAVGTLLESDTGYVPVVTGANCAAVLLEEVPLATLLAGDSEAVCLVKGPAIINSTQVTVTALQKTAALAALAALGIDARTEPTFSVGV